MNGDSRTQIPGFVGGTIIRDVSASLKKLIQENISELSEESAVRFDSPGDLTETPTRPTLLMYLLAMEQNEYYVNDPPRLEYNQDNTRVKRFLPPLVTLDLTYMFTPYAGDRDTELILADKLTALLWGHPVMEGDDLQGHLRPHNDELKIIPRYHKLQDLGQFWSSFPGKNFKFSLFNTVTPVRIPSGVVEDLPTMRGPNFNAGATKNNNESPEDALKRAEEKRVKG